MGRSARQNKLLEIISKNEIGTQEELVSKLNAMGFNATQATISRDIKDLNLIKVSLPHGRGYKYVASEKSVDNTYDKFLSIYRSTVLSIAANENIIVIKTESGSSGPAAEFIDNLKIPEIIGTLAGENSIFIAIDFASNTQKVKKLLVDLLD